MSPETVELAHAGGSVRVVQLTDCHLEEARGGQLLGLDTDDSLAHVLALLRADPSPPALLLATGDLANHGSPAAYLRLRGRLDRCGMPWFWLPGNHDDFPVMEAALGRGAPMVRTIRVGAWQIVMLDSTIPGEVGGELGAAELARLDRLLGAASGRHTLVCLHHQPVPIGCTWLDE